MDSRKKIAIAIAAFVGFVALASAGLGLAGYFYYQSFSEKAAVAQSAGRVFGKTTDQKGCMTEGLSRALKTTKYDVVKLVENGEFVEGCFETSQPTADFCTNVPPLRKSSEGQWEYKRCRESKMDSQTTGCKSIYEEHLMFCDRQARSTK